MNKKAGLLVISVVTSFLFPSLTIADGIFEMFGSIYFAAADGKSIEEENVCKLSTLRYLMCLTPLALSDYQTQRAQEILRLVLLDAMVASDEMIRFAADRVCERYAPHDKTGFLKNLSKYRLTMKDFDLMEQLKKLGKERYSGLCVFDPG